MKRIVIGIVASIVIATRLVTAADKTADAERQLKAAMNTELVDGPKAAIEQYRKVAESGVRPLAAQALLHMAECYQKIGDAEARRIYDRIVREFADQPAVVATAKTRMGISSTTVKAEPAHRRFWTLPDGGDIFGTTSRDGRYIPFTQWKDFGNLYVHDVVTGADRPLTNTGTDGKQGAPVDEFAEESAIARDDSRIAYSWFRSDTDRYDLRVVDLKGTGIPQSRVLYDSKDVDWLSPDDWSPDGKWIVVQVHRKDRTGQLGLVSVGDGTFRLLRPIDWSGTTKALFSPDGKFVAYDLPAGETTANRDIFILAVESGRETPIVRHPSHDALLGWTSDGKKLVFASNRSGSMSIWMQSVSDGASGAPELLKRDIGASWWNVGLTDAGTLFMVNSDYPTLFNIQMASIDMKTGQLTSSPVEAVSSFVGTNRSPAWSPDGSSLAYISLREGLGMRQCVIGIRSTDSSTTREIAISPNPESCGSLQWSPDGQSFIIVGSGANGIRGVYRVDARTGKSQLLAEDAVTVAVIGAGGRKIYFFRSVPASDTRRNIALIEKDLTTGTERELIRKPRLNNLNMSPDGTMLTVGLVPSVDAGNRASEILVVPTNGGDPRVVIRADNAAAVAVATWNPDSRSILALKVLAPDQWERWLVPVDGGAPTKLDREPVKAAIPPLMRLHPDGKRVAFAAQTQARKPEEVWVLENFLPASGQRK